jgi:hypothetical protein
MMVNSYIKFLKLFGFAFLFALVSCKSKPNFSELREVSFSKEIAPIVNSNCTFSGCHGDSAFQEFKLTTYAGVINAGVSAGVPEKSELYQVIKTLNQNRVMPKKPYSRLNEKQIQLIYVWIGQGAKNN